MTASTHFDVRTADLAALNSATKYPSIPTYHTLDTSNGSLLEETVQFTGPVLLTEKVDGTNARIIQLPDGNYLIGSREELLYAKGDLIGNPSQGIVDALRLAADSLPSLGDDWITIWYLEVYGGKIGSAAKQYTGQRRVGYRLFDVAVIRDHKTVLGWPRERISGWRESGGQDFVHADPLAGYARLVNAQIVPRLGRVHALDLPKSVEEMEEFLKRWLPTSRIRLDDGAGGRPEGIVLRSPSRSVVAKARFEDYERTLRRRNGQGRAGR